MGLLDAILVVAAAAPAPAFGPDSGPFRSVFVFRHCLRSTPTSAYGAEGYTDFNNYSGPQPGHAFPAWPVPVYQCLPEGKEVVQSMGEQLNATIPGQLTVMVDTSAQRDNDTALALLAGMGRPPTYTAAPEYFSPTKAGVCAALPTADAVAALKARFAAFPVPDGHSARLSALQAVLGAGVAPALNDIPDYVSSSAYLTGGTAVASAFAEAFLMELGGGLPVAWGGATEDAVYDFLATHIYYRSVQDRVFSKVQRSHAYMARSIVEFLFADVGREATPRESPREASLAFIGHDGDLDALAEMFGLQWHARPFPPNSTTPGSALRFDVDQDGKTVAASIVYQQFNAARPAMKTTPASFTWQPAGADSNLADMGQLLDWLNPRIVPECIPKMTHHYHTTL